MDETTNATRTWTTVASKYNRTDAQRARLSAIFSRLTWCEPKGDFPMAPALAIQNLIQELRIPRVSLIALNGVHAGRYGVYGIEGNYKNGRVRIYVLDVGSQLLVLASDKFAVEPVASVEATVE